LTRLQASNDGVYDGSDSQNRAHQALFASRV